MPSPFYLFILVSAYASVGENRILGWTEVGGKKTDVGGNMDKTKMIPAYYYYPHIFLKVELVIDIQPFQDIRMRASVVWLTMTLQA